MPAIKNVQIANIVYQRKQGVRHPAFRNYFTWVREFRNVKKLHIRQPINENSRKITKYHGAYIWNKLPDAVTKLPSFPTFKKKIKTHCLELQNC